MTRTRYYVRTDNGYYAGLSQDYDDLLGFGEFWRTYAQMVRAYEVDALVEVKEG